MTTTTKMDLKRNTKYINRYYGLQNILYSKQIYTYFENAITMALNKDFKLLGLFQDIHWE
jgi:hypothetical protein